MSVLVELQEKEFAAQIRVFPAAKHQRKVGTSYFEQIGQVCTRSTNLSAMEGSAGAWQYLCRLI